MLETLTILALGLIALGAIAWGQTMQSLAKHHRRKHLEARQLARHIAHENARLYGELAGKVMDNASAYRVAVAAQRVCERHAAEWWAEPPESAR